MQDPGSKKIHTGHAYISAAAGLIAMLWFSWGLFSALLVSFAAYGAQWTSKKFSESISWRADVATIIAVNLCAWGLVEVGLPGILFALSYPPLIFLLHRV